MILATVSGGLDSVTMAYKLLTETSEDVVIYHISMRTRREDGRWLAEDAAMLRIIPWLREHCRPFDYVTSVYTRQCARPDIVVVSEQAGALCKRRGWRPSLARGANAHDMGDGEVGSRQRRAAMRWEAAFGYQDVPPIIFPIGHMTRADTWAYLPAELRVMTTSCRRPWAAGPVYTPCGTCHACHGMRRAGIPLERDVICAST